MAYKDDIKSDIKLWLTLENEYDDKIDLIIKMSTNRILSRCFRTEEEVELDESLKQLILLDSIISFNKMGHEGQDGVKLGVYSSNFELQQDYTFLLNSCTHLGVY